LLLSVQQQSSLSPWSSTLSSSSRIFAAPSTPASRCWAERGAVVGRCLEIARLDIDTRASQPANPANQPTSQPLYVPCETFVTSRWNAPWSRFAGGKKSGHPQCVLLLFVGVHTRAVHEFVVNQVSFHAPARRHRWFALSVLVKW